MSADFVHLHNHTEYSLLDGACKVDAMLKRSVEFGMPAVAMTDHGGLYGAIEFYEAALKQGIKPIIGCEAYICKNRFEKSGSGIGRGEYAHHLLLLARNEIGYKNLIKISSTGYTEGFYYRPRVDHEFLAAHSEGLIATSGCMASEVPSLLMDDDEAAAWEKAKWYQDVFGENYYIEVQRHNMPEEKKLNPRLEILAKKLGAKLVATNDTHYLKSEQAEAHDILLCIGTAANLSDTNRMRFPGNEFYLKSPDEMKRLFADLPEALLNTCEIAEKCELQLDLKNHFLPDFPLPEGETSAMQYLTRLARAGMARRYGTVTQALEDRLNHELQTIEKMNFAGYFLIVADFITYAKSIGVTVGPGRGSAAGSLVCYTLGITDLDPVRFELYFERFLNPERISLPDIDIDFQDEGREKIIEYVRQRYGNDSVTQIVTFGRMKARGVLRDVARVLGVSYGDADKLAKKIPDDIGINLERSLENNPELVAMLKERPDLRKVWDIGMVLEGTSRHTSTHAAGVVITPGPLTDYVPLCRQSDGSITTQYDMTSVEHIGLLKMDFLGLRTLSVISKALKFIEDRGIKVDLTAIVEEFDEKTYEFLGNGNTTSVFQLESSGMREWLTKLKPTCIDDIVAMVALYRPGPMAMIGDFVKRKHGLEQISYLHPALESALNSTYGIIVYQEQVMRIARDLAGFSLGKADILRRAMGKKKKEEMVKVRNEFIEGCASHSKINKKLASQIFELVEKFAQYGFNKSHAACYGILAYQTAYLKVHFPAEFMAAEMSSYRGETRVMQKLINDCRKNGIGVRPPDVNFSDELFTVEENEIRCGLQSIKNIGGGPVAAITEARKQGGPFKSFYDFAARVDIKQVNRKVMESLIGAGALDSLGGHRAQYMVALDSFFAYAAQAQLEREQGQSSLFGGGGGGESHLQHHELPDIKPYNMNQQLAIEKELLGYYISGHPLDECRKEIEQLANAFLGDLSELRDGTIVNLAGLISAVRRTTTKKGTAMATVTLEDLTGSADVLIFSDVLDKCTKLLEKEAKVVIVAKVSCREEKDTTFVAQEVYTLDEAKAVFAQSMWLTLKGACLNQDTFNALEDIFLKHSGSVPVFFKIEQEDKTRIFQSRRYKLHTSMEVVKTMQEVLGVDRVKVGWH